jgi:hypothetical protein
LLLPFPVSAYHKRLTQEEVTEAYYFGQRHDTQLAAFFNRCQRSFPAPREAGDYISAVAVRTPYALAVLRSYSALNHYSAQDAWRDYLAAPDQFEVVAYLDYTYGNKTAPPAAPPVTGDSVRGYYVQVKQWRHNEERTIVAKEGYLERGLIGPYDFPETLEIHSMLSTQDVDSSDLTVEVTIPTGRKVVVTFNLEELR